MSGPILQNKVLQKSKFGNNKNQYVSFLNKNNLQKDSADIRRKH